MAKKSDNTPRYKLIDDTPDYKLIDNPIDRRYRDRFNDFRSSNDSLGSAESGSSDQTRPNAESRRMGKKNKRSSSGEVATTEEDNTNLANQENAQPEGFRYNPRGSKDGNNSTTSSSDGGGASSSSIKRIRARIANRVRKTGGKKTAAYAAGALGGGVGMALLIFILIMYLMGFGTKQVAIVIRNFSFGRIYNLAARQAERLVKAKGEFKIGKENPDSIRDPKGLSEDIKNLDLDRVAKNLETKPFEFEERSGKLVVKNGSTEIDMSKSDSSEKLVDHIRGGSDPLKTDAAAFENPTANSTLRTSGVEKFAWSEDTLNKTAKETTEKARTTEQKATYDRVRGSPGEVSPKDDNVKRAQDEIKDPTTGIEPAVSSTTDTAMEAKGRSIGAVVNKLRGNLGKFTDFMSSWSLPMTVLMSVCTVEQVTQSYENEAKNATEQSQRQAGKLQSINDQYQHHTNGQVVGADVHLLGDILSSGAYQQAIGNINAASNAYNQLQDSDYPIPRVNGVLKSMLMLDAFLATFHQTDFMPGLGPGFQAGLNNFNNLTGLNIENPTLKDQIVPICNGLSDSRVAFSAAAASIVIEVALMVSGVGEVASGAQAGIKGAQEAGGEAVEGGIRMGVSAATDEVMKKSIIKSIEEFLSSIKEYATKFANPQRFISKYARDYAVDAANHGVMSRTVAATVAAGIDMGGDFAKWFGIGYFANKMAGMDTGNEYNGTEDGLFIDKAAAGTEVMQSNQQRTQMFGKPLGMPQVAQLDKSQQNRFLEKQKHLSLYTRFASLSNPYSLLSRVLVGPTQFVASLYGTPFTKSMGIVKGSMVAGFASVFTPDITNSGIGKLISATITPRKVTYAAAANMQINHFNVPQFGYEQDEIDKMTNDPNYSTFNIAKWAAANKDDVEDFDDAFNKCFDPSTKFIQAYGLIAAGLGWVKPDEGGSGPCTTTEAMNFFYKDIFGKRQLPKGTSLKWRLYHADLNEMANLKNLEEVTENSSTSSTAGTSIDMDHIYDDSTSIACAPGTNDIGIQDGYRTGNLVKIRICAIPNMTSTASESTPGNEFYIQGADGKLIVNSRVSGAVQSMAEAAKKDGINPIASSGFRSMAHQECLYSGRCPGTTPARPGTSNHQMGLAIDVGDSAMNSWMKQHGEEYGFKWLGASDPVHFSVTGN